MFKKNSFQGLVTTILENASTRPHFVIAISGFGGAGKGTLAEKLANDLQKKHRHSNRRLYYKSFIGTIG